jgi:two-component system, chemotaxis family, protein-glutamate methylesterase/glutaminase
MPPIRILVVDDSVVIRKVLTDTLASDRELQVVGAAGDGRIGLAKMAQLHPDLITLDIEMPVLSGLETLVEVRKLYPRLPVIMFSTLTERGAAATLEALSLGASDYVTKPSTAGGMSVAVERIRADLIPKIKALCERQSSPLPPAQSVTATQHTHHARSGSQPIEIVAIGASTGGPAALAELLPGIPKDFPVPIVAVQHMPPLFTRILAERLASRSNIPVEEGAAGTTLAPAHAWIAPGNFHMTVKRTGLNSKLQLNQDLPENSCRPAVDVLFRGVASVYGASALGVVMTGMGSDGLKGSQRIRESGGQVIVQDEASSVVWGMPGAVYTSGNADAVYPLGQLAHEITRRVLESHGQQRGAGNPIRNLQDMSHTIR